MTEFEKLIRIRDFLRARLATEGSLSADEWAELERVKARLEELPAPEPQQAK